MTTRPRDLEKKIKGCGTLFAFMVLFCLLMGCSQNRDLIVPSPVSQDERVASFPKRDLIVLLPDPDGKVGSLWVTTEGGSEWLDKAGYATEVEERGTPPTEPKPLPEGEIMGLFGPALLAQPDLADRFVSFVLYFESDTTKLTDRSQEALPEIVNAIRNRRIIEIYVVGHTDRLGTEAYNMGLSWRRATYIRDLLVSKGIPSKAMVVSYHGEAMPAVPTEDEVPEPRNRRVEVFIR